MFGHIFMRDLINFKLKIRIKDVYNIYIYIFIITFMN